MTGVPAIAEPGRQYALYASHSYIRNVPNGPGFYEAVPGDYQETITLKSVPAGNYRAEWFRPSDLSPLLAATLQHPGGDLSLPTPRYAIDIALRLKLLSR